MACFVVPMAEAIVMTVLKKAVEKNEKKSKMKTTSENHSSLDSKTGLSWSRKLGWLNQMLWGGVLLLVVEHLWHGEIVPWPPFLTALNNPADVSPMINEMSTVGTAMALVVTAVWAIVVLIAERKAKAYFTGLKKEV